MAIDIRPIAADEVEEFGRVMSLAFGFDMKEERLEWWSRIVGRTRTVAAFDGDEMVGTGGGYPLHVTVPGGAAVATGGTTMIAVKPTHRRRGVLTAMMKYHLADVADHEEPLAALWASESSIYGRFGYGPAAYLHEVRIARDRARFARPLDAPGEIRIVPTEEALPALMSVYDAVAPTRPGMLARSRDWWEDERLQDFEEWRDGKTAFRIAVYSEDDEPLGFARYRTKSDWGSAGPKGTVHLIELLGATETARLALWEYLFGIDLIAEIKAWNQPVDDTLRWQLNEPRRLETQVQDALWVRLMDVPAALSARKYWTAGRLVLEVRDHFWPAGAGRYVLEGGPDGAACSRTEAEPDLVLGASDLGALYLGGNRALTLARAGRIDGDRDAARLADAMFHWDPAPWCPEVF